MPKEIFGHDFPFLPRAELLSFEEITRLARIFVANGVEKIRLTGGEPLLRKDIEQLISMLRGIDGLRDLTLTTNGTLLARKAATLRAAGLDRVTVSLDSLDDEVFSSMNDVGFPVARVLEGIEAADRAGLRPIKVNMVVKRGINDHQVVEMARHFRGSGHIVRFIEFMDVGASNGWQMEQVVPSSEIVRIIGDEWALEPADPNYRGEVAARYRYVDGKGEVGVISSVTQPFCGACSRARLSADGKLFTCLFATHGQDFRAILRNTRSDEEITAVLARLWGRRDDHYSDLRSEQTAELPKIEMSYIGG